MTRFYITLMTVLAMGCLIPLAPILAVSADSPIYTHFVYMFGHANLLHWLVNGWGLLVLHNLFRSYRVVVCWLFAVFITFTPIAASCSQMGLIGASVLTTFFFGFLTPHLRKTDKTAALQILAIIVIGFFLPGIAAMPHLAMYLFGLVFFYLERTCLRFIWFCRE